MGIHHLLRLDNYSDHLTKETWDYSAWIRVYSIYLDERLEVWRTIRFETESNAQGAGHGSYAAMLRSLFEIPAFIGLSS